VDAVLWVVLAVALAIAEAFTATLLVAMFAAGALAAAGAAGLGAPLLVQVIVFAIVSALSVAAIRPYILRHAQREDGDTAFGVDAIEGSHAVVLEEVDADQGMIKIDGEMWQARSFDGSEKYLPGERVRVVKLRGATAIVWRDNLPNL
jgi:membrane protein implicated in regulation of membrane protease activity